MSNWTPGKIGAIVAGAVLAIGVVVTPIATLRHVPVGYAGLVHRYGEVTNDILRAKWYFIPPTKKLTKFTIANELLVLSKDKRDGSKDDESFSVATADDASIPISFQMTYKFNEDTLVETFKNFRGLSGEEIINLRLTPVLKTKISEVTTFYTMMEIYSGDRAKINKELTEYLNEQFSKTYGITVLDASIIDVHPDKKLKTAIDARVTALQQKQQAEAEQETAKVQAETEQIKAKVQAETKQMEAETEANIKIIEAEAEAKANQLKAASITDELIRMKEAEARVIHGWINIQGADSVIVDDTNTGKK